jgi:hypothetical protein
MTVKTAPILLIVTICFASLLAHAQATCACAQCKVLIDHGIRIFQCGGIYESPGPCCCNITSTDCVPGGCCQYIPGTGAVCYDPTGGECGLEGCQEGGTKVGGMKVGLKETLKTPESHEVGKASSREELLESSPWLTDTAFQQRIEALAPEMGLLVKYYQDRFRDDWKNVHYREVRTIAGKVLLRNVSYNFEAVKVEHNWRLELWPDPDDPDSRPFGPGVPNALEILGRDWKLIHHIHGVDKTDNIVASGTY